MHLAEDREVEVGQVMASVRPALQVEQDKEGLRLA